MRYWTPLVSSLWAIYPAASYAAAIASVQSLHSILTAGDVHFSAATLVAFPNTTDFVNATVRRDHFGEPTFGASITPATEEDVALAVKLARKHNVTFLATGGRHGSGLGYGKMRGGIAIDLSHFKSFEVHANSSTVTIGGAATVGEFHDQLSDAGLMLPSGSCSCPGFAGLAVGGGIGRYMGSLGLVTDRLISARVVTAQGDVVQISARENADLFWAMRGAGGNFGVIVSATYQAARKADHAGGYVLTADLVFPADKVPAYFQYMEKIGGSLPGNVGGLHLMRYNATVGRAELFANWVFFGPEAEGRAFLAQFLAMGPYSVTNYEYIQTARLNQVAGDGFGAGAASCAPGVYTDTYSNNLKTYSASLFQDVFDAMDAFYAANPEAREGTLTNLSLFPNQAVAEKGHDFNAYAWRDTRGFLSVGAGYTSAGLQNQTVKDAGDKLGAIIREWCKKKGGFGGKQTGAIYINYSRGDESLEEVFGDKLPRLVQLKKKWDPSNVFAFNNPLPTSLGSS